MPSSTFIPPAKAFTSDPLKQEARPDASRYATADLDSTASHKLWNEEKEKAVRAPFQYLYDQPGKNFRSQMITAFDAWLAVPKKSLEIITRVVGMLHTASLLVDDVEDSSNLRRGLPVAHNIFGVPQAINSANYIYFVALQELQKIQNSKMVGIFADELAQLHRGQGMDLFWRDNLECPSEEDYLNMVGNKTGGLFRLGIKLMQAESGTLMDCVPLVNLMGLIFQIGDDYKNLMSETYSNNKGNCEDLTEGKFSFPIIHAIRANVSDRTVMNILRMRTTDDSVKDFAVNHMKRLGSFEYTKDVLRILIDRARKMVDEMEEDHGKNEGMRKILEKMEVN
jgi:geranylgeranyl diphosphate synthase, type III